MRRDGGRTPRFPAVAIGPALFLVAFFLVPFAIVAMLSVSEVATAIPPYRPVLRWSDGLAGWLDKAQMWSLANFATLAGDRLYIDAFLTSLTLAATGTLILLLIGYPLAQAIARAPERLRPALLIAIILPFWTSFLIRVYAWIGILKPDGFLNDALMVLGLSSTRLEILNTQTAVLIGIVYAYLPFMVLPLYASIERLDRSLVEAARDLGASPTVAFIRITLPLTLPGIIAGSLLCFIPIMGEVIIPDLLGGNDTLMLGKTLWVEFFSNRDWPVASAVAVLLTLTLVAPILLWQRAQARALSEAAR